LLWFVTFLEPTLSLLPFSQCSTLSLRFSVLLIIPLANLAGTWSNAIPVDNEIWPPVELAMLKPETGDPGNELLEVWLICSASMPLRLVANRVKFFRER
jgi:hypothetical protein